jgi:hypothetical protein
MNHDEQDKLWELLGKAPKREASPFFANKVMRAIREPEVERFSIWAWLRQKWIIPVAAGACAVIAAVSTLNTGTSSKSVQQVAKVDPLAEMVTVIAANDEFESSLSDLLATEDNAVWLEADPSSLF